MDMDEYLEKLINRYADSVVTLTDCFARTVAHLKIQELRIKALEILVDSHEDELDSRRNRQKKKTKAK